MSSTFYKALLAYSFLHIVSLQQGSLNYTYDLDDKITLRRSEYG